MKRLASALIALQLIALSAHAAEEKAPCASLCVGAVVTPDSPVQAIAPLLITVSDRDFAAAGSAIANFTPEQKRQAVVVVETTIEGSDRLTSAETKARNIVEWARVHGPFDTLALEVRDDDPAIAAYALKRIAVAAQGLDVAARIGIKPSEKQTLQNLGDQGAVPYFDAVIVPASDVANTVTWLAEKDPSKKIYALVAAESPN